MTVRFLFASLFACTTLISSAQIPSLLRDINPSGNSSTAVNTCANGLVFFRATDGAHGLEPWASDGTTEGTVMLRDINPGADGSLPLGFIAWNGQVYFAADNGVDGYQLWSTDGTVAGTQFELAIDDVQDLESSSNFTVYNDMIVFSGLTGALGGELWRTDGTVDGTQLILDINPGTLSSSPREFMPYNGLLYFSARSPGVGEELWVTDGTAAGTHLVKDIDEGTGAGTPSGLAVANGLLFFNGDDGFLHGTELWATDGTTEGTTLVKDIIPGSNSSLPRNLVAFNNEVWFTAYTGSESHIWHSDGTEAGTVMLEVPVELLTEPDKLAVHGGSIYFAAYIDTFYKQLWRTDGTAAGTVQIVDPGSTSVSPLSGTTSITSCGDLLFFSAAYDEAVGAEPYTLLSPVGIGEQRVSNNARLYPNPTTDRLTMVDAPAKGTLRLFATDGSLALETNVYDMDLSALPTGLYLARIRATDGTVLHVQRVVKE